MGNDTGFELSEIEAFVAIVRRGSFRTAAEDLGVAQSSLSQRLVRLEEKLHARLFDRTTRSVALTSAGRDLMIYAEALMGVAEHTRLHFEQPPRDGVLRLGIVEDYVVGDLHRILSIFCRQFPRFKISLRTGLSTSLFDAVEDGTLDVALAKQRPGRGRGHRLFTEPLVWAGNATAIAGGGTIPLAVYPAPSATRTAILETLREAGRLWTIATESLGLAGIVAAVEAGFAVSAFSARFLPATVAAIPAEANLPLLPSLDYVVDQRGAPRDPAVDAFIQILVAAIGDDGPPQDLQS